MTEPPLDIKEFRLWQINRYYEFCRFQDKRGLKLFAITASGEFAVYVSGKLLIQTSDFEQAREVHGTALEGKSKYAESTKNI